MTKETEDLDVNMGRNLSEMIGRQTENSWGERKGGEWLYEASTRLMGNP